MFGSYEEDRFVTIYQNGEGHHHTMDCILKDTKTGVLYFERAHRQGWGTMVPLIDADGKPLVEPVE